jgi:hypothetical protein
VFGDASVERFRQLFQIITRPEFTSQGVAIPANVVGPIAGRDDVLDQLRPRRRGETEADGSLIGVVDADALATKQGQLPGVKWPSVIAGRCRTSQQ